MNGAHREIHHPACPLLLRRRTPRQGMNAPAQKTGVLFPARSKTPLSSLLRPGCSSSFLLNPSLSVVVSCPFSLCLSPLTLPPFASIPAACCHRPLSFCLSRSLFRLSPQSRPPVVPSLFPLVFTACASLFPNPVFTAGKRPQKKSFPYGKDFLSSALPNPANKKTFSERTLKRFPFKMDQTNSMMTRRAASPLRGSSFMIRV